jgi:hypothetical protein
MLQLKIRRQYVITGPTTNRNLQGHRNKTAVAERNISVNKSTILMSKMIEILICFYSLPTFQYFWRILQILNDLNEKKKVLFFFSEFLTS